MLKLNTERSDVKLFIAMTMLRLAMALAGHTHLLEMPKHTKTPRVIAPQTIVA